MAEADISLDLVSEGVQMVRFMDSWTALVPSYRLGSAWEWVHTSSNQDALSVRSS